MLMNWVELLAGYPTGAEPESAVKEYLDGVEPLIRSKKNIHLRRFRHDRFRHWGHHREDPDSKGLLKRGGLGVTHGM